MTVLYHNRHRLTEQEEQKLCATHAELNTLLSESDFVSLHVPLTPETRHLMGRAELQLMKPTAFLINASRGPVVDEEALVETLRSSTIAGAALDVYENEPALTPGLVELDNVVLLPHVGSATREARTRMGQLAVDNLLKGLRGEIPPNCLNPRLK
jgi:glyoxylate reductase